MKSICKLVLLASLFTSAAFAGEGDLPNGNRNCPNGQTTCFVGGETTNPETKSSDAEDSVLTVIQNYLDSVIAFL